MRWRLLVITSFVASAVNCALWSSFAIVLFGSAKDLASHGSLFWISVAVLAALILFAGFFTYRHTARRRKTQAIITAILAFVLTIGLYFAASQLFPRRLSIPRSYDLRQAR